MEEFSQQKNAKLKHFLLNEEEEFGGLRNDELVRDMVV